MDAKNRENEDGYIELNFGPRWKYISVVRGFVQNFMAVSFEDQAKADKIAMAVSELLENAVKYACNEETQLKLYTDSKEKSIKIVVTNITTKSSAETLRTIYDKVSTKEPLQAYIDQMKEAAAREDGKSQLGLVRIRYETGADMDLSISDTYQIRFTLVIK